MVTAVQSPLTEAQENTSSKGSLARKRKTVNFG
jgi:hypothetical protein